MFQNVREKESLAYTVRSRYYRFKDFMIIYAGIEKSNYDKAKEVILEQLKQMETGNITESEFNAAKKNLISDLNEWYDSKIALSKMILTSLLFYKNTDMSLEKMIQGIEDVTIDDIINVSKKIKVEMIYLLGGQNNE
ncbi:Peptidase M16 inactive domain protein [compost metagenome]